VAEKKSHRFRAPVKRVGGGKPPGKKGPLHPGESSLRKVPEGVGGVSVIKALFATKKDPSGKEKNWGKPRGKSWTVRGDRTWTMEGSPPRSLTPGEGQVPAEGGRQWR